MITAGSFAAVGAAASLWPLIQQMNPDASTQALASTEIDLKPIQQGQAITVMWRGKPVFIRNRTPDEIKKAVDTPLAELIDASARNEALPEKAPATDLNRTKKGKENWLVMVGICTHLGCIPKGQSLCRYEGRLWRLVLPVPRLALRYGRPHPQRPCAPQSRRSARTSSCPTRRSRSAKAPST